jgi:hypothetical protein
MPTHWPNAKPLADDLAFSRLFIPGTPGLLQIYILSRRSGNERESKSFRDIGSENVAASPTSLSEEK